MSDPQIKPIKINPELFKINPKTVRNKTLRKPKAVTEVKSNKLKNDLLTRIKKYRQNQNSSSSEIQIINPPIKQQNLDNSNKIPATNNIDKVNYKNDTKTDTKTNIKHTIPNDDDDDFTQTMSFLKELSTKNKKKQNSTETFPLTLAKNTEEFESSSEKKPQYSCLKNGSLPTFREWKNKTLKKSSEQHEQPESSTQFELSELPQVESSEFTESLKLKDENNTERNLGQNNKLKTKTLKYCLGKRGRKISVLIKNSDTRKKITGEHNKLKEIGLSDMKKYLKRHNLLKSGSYAGPDIIKKMYEQALLGGDIRNSNKTNLIHNYLAES